jgi:hypothetical protein
LKIDQKKIRSLRIFSQKNNFWKGFEAFSQNNWEKLNPGFPLYDFLSKCKVQGENEDLIGNRYWRTISCKLCRFVWTPVIHIAGYFSAGNFDFCSDDPGDSAIPPMF